MNAGNSGNEEKNRDGQENGVDSREWRLELSSRAWGIVLQQSVRFVFVFLTEL